MVKKIFPLFLALLLVFSFTGCKKQRLTDAEKEIVSKIHTEKQQKIDDIDWKEEDYSLVKLENKIFKSESRNVEYNDGDVAITKGGTYVLKGYYYGGIVVDTNDEVNLVFNTVQLFSNGEPAINVLNANYDFDNGKEYASYRTDELLRNDDGTLKIRELMHSTDKTLLETVEYNGRRINLYKLATGELPTSDNYASANAVIFAMTLTQNNDSFIKTQVLPIVEKIDALYAGGEVDYSKADEIDEIEKLIAEAEENGITNNMISNIILICFYRIYINIICPYYFISSLNKS